MAGSRDPERIDRIVELLRRYWTEHPDLRLGQIVGNAAGAMGRDPYYIEDEEVETDLRLSLQPEAQPAGAPSRLNAESMPSVPDLPPRDETGRWTNQPAGAPEPGEAFRGQMTWPCLCGHPKAGHYYGDQVGADGWSHSWCQLQPGHCQDFQPARGEHP